MQDSRTELRVGIFVFIGTIVFGFMVITFGFKNLDFVKTSYRIQVVYQFTNGVVLGAPVRVAGVEVGKVIHIEFDKDNHVLMDIVIREGIVIREDVRAIINALGLMGEKYVELMPVGSTARILREGDKIEGEEPVALDDLLKQGQTMLTDVNQVLKEILDKENVENIKKIIKNIKQITGEENQKILKELLGNIQSLTNNEMREKVIQTIDQYQVTATTIGSTASSLKKLVDDNHVRIKDVLEKWARFTDNLNDITGKVKEGKGTLGLLLNDPVFHDKLVETLKNFNQWISNIRKHGLMYKEKETSTRSSRFSRSK